MQSDVLCAFEVIDSAGGRHVDYAFISAPSAQSGTHKPRQVFVCLDYKGVDLSNLEPDLGPRASLFRGLLLELSTSKYWQPQNTVYYPEQPAKVGRLRMYMSDAFAAHLLDMPILVDEKLDAVEVSATVPLFQEILPGLVRILGVDNSMSSLLVKADHVMFGEQDANESDDLNLPSVVGAAIPISGEVDLLQLLEQQSGCQTRASDGKPPRKRTKTTKPVQPPMPDDEQTPSNPKNRDDAVLDDPSLRAFLTEDDIEAVCLQSSADCRGRLRLDCSNGRRGCGARS